MTIDHFSQRIVEPQRMSETRRTFLISAGALALGMNAPSARSAAPLRMAYFETYSPFSFRDGKTMRGIFIDILNEVLARRLRTPLMHTGYPWLRAQYLVQTGAEDAICTVPSKDRMVYGVASEEPVLSMPLRLFVRADNPLYAQLSAVQSLEDLRRLNPTILSYVGNGRAKDTLAGFNVDWGGTFVNSVEKLIGGRGDVIVENNVSMGYTMKLIAGSENIRMLPNPVGATRFHLIIGKRSPYLPLLSAFDDEMKKFKSEPEYKAIFHSYRVMP